MSVDKELWSESFKDEFYLIFREEIVLIYLNYRL